MYFPEATTEPAWVFRSRTCKTMKKLIDNNNIIDTHIYTLSYKI